MLFPFQLVLAAVLAVASANPLTYYAGAPAVVHHTAGVPLTYTSGVVHQSPVPVVYTSALHQTVPVVHTTATKVVHSYKPVEQHGYQIVY
jgi:hypothetical protein